MTGEWRVDRPNTDPLWFDTEAEALAAEAEAGGLAVAWFCGGVEDQNMPQERTGGDLRAVGGVRRLPGRLSGDERWSA